MTQTYAPGDWVAVTGATTWLLADLPFADARLEPCWEAVRNGGAHGALEALLGSGLSALPGFVLVEAGEPTSGTDQLRVVVRHPARASAVVDGAEIELAPEPGGTWLDRTLTGCTSIMLSSGSAGPQVRLPIGLGITPAGLLALTFGGGRTTPGAPAPAEATIEPEPPSEPEPTQEPRRAATYYGLLVNSTTDRDALLAQLADDAETSDGDLSPEPAVDAALEPVSGHTAVWDVDERADTGDALPPSPPDPTPAPTPGLGGLIEGVPWLVKSAGEPPTAPAPTVRPAPPVPPVPPAAALPPVTTPPPEDDHEAEARTINRAALLASMETAGTNGPLVLALRCSSGHLTSPYAAHCRVCGSALGEQQPVQVPRPSLGVLRLSTGATVALDRDVILGRAPEHDETDPARRPNLVRLTASGEISRRHVGVTLDGWQPLVRDLGSANGTTLTLPGGRPQQLRADEDYPLEAGAVVSLADVVAFTFEVTP